MKSTIPPSTATIVTFPTPVKEQEPKRRAGQLKREGVSLDDFHAHLPSRKYIFTPTLEPWPAESVNAAIAPIPLIDRNRKPLLDDKGKPKLLSASQWLDQHKAVAQMTWAPGEPTVIADRLVSDGGWINRPGCRCLNLYRPPQRIRGGAKKAAPWVDHVRRVYGEDASHIIRWLAQRVQRPAEKINHALVLGGAQGIGKDTLLAPVKHAIGAWNFADVTPHHILGRFNSFVRSVIMRVSEARDLGDIDRFGFYDHMKLYTAAPPDVLRCDEKNLREHAIFNVTGVIVTTNHKTDGIFLPADDRRHFVAWSPLTKNDFDNGYWRLLWSWFETGGNGHVAAYLRELDLTDFDAKAPPPKTVAFWEIVNANRAPEDSELADALDAIGRPAALTLRQVAARADAEFSGWLRDRKNARRVPHRLEACGYTAVPNDAAEDGRWKVDGCRQTIYGRADLSIRDRLAAAQRLAGAR